MRPAESHGDCGFRGPSGLRCIPAYPVRSSGAAVSEAAAVASWLEEIAGPPSSSENWCLWLGRAPASQAAPDFRGGARCGVRHVLRVKGWGL